MTHPDSTTNTGAVEALSGQRLTVSGLPPCSNPIDIPGYECVGADNDGHSSTHYYAALRATPTPASEAGVEYEVWQADAFGDGDAMVAGSTSLADARHYAMMYSQDGPAWVVEVTRRALSPTKEHRDD